MIRTGLLAAALAAPAAAETEVTPFVENVVIHVVMHEMAHALIREFDLPVLGNEEVIADAFATLAVAEIWPDRAADIVMARAASLWLEGEQSGEADLWGEHPPDTRRAFRAACLLYGSDPGRFGEIAQLVDMPRDAAEDCAEAAPEIARSWRRIVAPYRMPEGRLSTEFRLIYEDGPLTAEMQESGVLAELAVVFRNVDWHSQITLRFANCDGAAEWSRNGRTITLCDSYVERFAMQEGEISGG
ncbi:DUF4344 domain-containing metallopeptidase [Aestuariibius sp. 2305UL40-4]|uniref:DUF4344 domain-containing metallopeptidase n=1 Tax=Aestuariibius violaceus TaxID=3234132 RepID=UPI00345EE0B1